MTMTSAPIGMRPSQLPNASAGLISTPSSLTFRSVRGNDTR
jgi:hypothetical protein